MPQECIYYEKHPPFTSARLVRGLHRRIVLVSFRFVFFNHAWCVYTLYCQDKSAPNGADHRDQESSACHLSVQFDVILDSDCSYFIMTAAIIYAKHKMDSILLDDSRLRPRGR